MIRRLENADLDAAAALWLEGNLQAHAFLPAQYWRSHFAQVRGLLAQAEVYVYETDGVLQGFAGLEGAYIAGLFVAQEARSQGVGKALLDFLKTRRQSLRLHVYQKNTRAAAFYRREGFRVREAGIDPATGEAEDCMVWSAAG